MSTAHSRNDIAANKASSTMDMPPDPWQSSPKTPTAKEKGLSM